MMTVDLRIDNIGFKFPNIPKLYGGSQSLKIHFIYTVHKLCFWYFCEILNLYMNDTLLKAEHIKFGVYNKKFEQIFIQVTIKGN